MYPNLIIVSGISTMNLTLGENKRHRSGFGPIVPRVATGRGNPLTNQNPRSSCQRILPKIVKTSMLYSVIIDCENLIIKI